MRSIGKSTFRFSTQLRKPDNAIGKLENLGVPTQVPENSTVPFQDPYLVLYYNVRGLALGSDNFLLCSLGRIALLFHFL